MKLKKIYITMILIGIILQTMVIAQVEDELDPNNFEGNELRVISQQLRDQKNDCESAITQYRSEMERVVDTQSDNLYNKVNNFVKQQKIVIVLAVIVSSFIGSTISSWILRREEWKAIETFMDKVIDSMDKFEKKLTKLENKVGGNND